MISILGFAWLASVGNALWLLAVVIAFEYLGVGLGTAAFTAFIARESSRAFAATQFALFTALAALPRSLANAVTGFIVEETGWVWFFFLCTLLAIPGMITLIWVAPWQPEAAASGAGANQRDRNEASNTMKWLLFFYPWLELWSLIELGAQTSATTSNALGHQCRRARYRAVSPCWATNPRASAASPA